MDETNFFARDRLILVLGQKGDRVTRYPQIICYATIEIYWHVPVYWHNLSKISFGVNQYPNGVNLGSSDHVLPTDFLVCYAEFKRI